MALNKIRLGDLIEIVDEKNINLLYSVECVRGISTQKFFIETKANMDGVSLRGYKIVYPECFAYVPDTSRRGDKISLAFNNTNNIYLVSAISVVFKIKDTSKLLPNYLFMFYNRPEFDRYSRYNSFGSAREPFNWSDMCDIELELPDLETQQKFVNIYLSMVENQKAYERGLDDLKLICDCYIEDLRRKYKPESLKPYISRVDTRNGINGTKNVKGVSTSKEFREPTSKVNKDELANYKVVKPRQISFVQTTHNEKVFCNAFNNTNEDIVVTPVNEVFECDETKLLPEYLCMIFNRAEFDRYARFHSWGSARETFTWDDLICVKIVRPDIIIQKAIVNIYNSFQSRKQINEKLKQQIKDICPILIKGSIEEARGE